MSKPWEEEWALSDGRWIEVPAGGERVTVARFGVDNESGGARAMLAVAAPVMARALKALTDAVEKYRGEHGPSHALDAALGVAYEAMSKGGMPL